jgi:hypothetical protein
MVEIIAENDRLIFGLPGWQGDIKKRLEYPIDHVAGASADPYITQVVARNWVNRLNFMNAYLPNLPKRDMIYEDGDCIFWGVENPDKTIIVYLEDEAHTQIIVEVGDPAAAVSLVTRAIAQAPAN